MTAGGGVLDVEALISAAYPELRARARRMSRGAPASLAGTAGLHTVLERILRVREEARRARRPVKEFASPEHFVGYCLVSLRHVWLSHHESKQARTAREERSILGSLSFVLDEERSLAPDDVAEVTALLRDLLADRGIPRRRQIARAVELCVLAGFSHEEARRILRIGKGTLQARLAQFKTWAELSLSPRQEAVRAHLDALLDDPAIGRRARIYEAARRCLLEHEPPAKAAAALGSGVPEVLEDLRFFRAYAVARSGRGLKAGAADAEEAA